jgi:hypothetical protein
VSGGGGDPRSGGVPCGGLRRIASVDDHEVERAGLQQHAPAFTGTMGNPHYNGNCKRILSQSPPPGTKLPKGATVSIVYGVCPHAIAHGHSSLSAHH